MEVKIISKETIKPFSSTPQHLRTYNLSLLDQIAPPQYIPIVLFYSPPSTNNIHINPNNISHHLKQSFALTLTHFYPLAGRMKDAIFNVDCNDFGASYTEANVAVDMSMVIQEANLHQLEKLIPCKPYEVLPEISSHEFLKAQVNYFTCGGIAISVCLWHLIGDGVSAASFIASWAAIASGCRSDSGDIADVVFERTTLFPPQDVKSLWWLNTMSEESLSNIVMNRFVFDGSKLAALRKEVGNIGPYLDHPTRIEAIAALIWKAVMDATGKEYIAALPMDLRKRMDPPLPNNCIGNLNHVTFASANGSLNLDYNSLAGKLHESIEKIDNEYVMKIHANGEYFKRVREIASRKRDGSEGLKIVGISSWCRFPFYDADFGWGKPTWVTPALVNRGVFLLDTKDGDGIEAWIGLPKDVMPKFEQNPDICAFASFHPKYTN